MKPDRSHNDLIVLACVAVLAVLLIGIIALAFADRSIGEEAYVVAGAIVGVIGGYVTAGRSKTPTEVVTDVVAAVPEDAGTATPVVAVASDAPLVEDGVVPPPVMSADEAYGGVGHVAYTEITEEELDRA